MPTSWCARWLRSPKASTGDRPESLVHDVTLLPRHAPSCGGKVSPIRSEYAVTARSGRTRRASARQASHRSRRLSRPKRRPAAEADLFGTNSRQRNHQPVQQKLRTARDESPKRPDSVLAWSVPPAAFVHGVENRVVYRASLASVDAGNAVSRLRCSL